MADKNKKGSIWIEAGLCKGTEGCALCLDACREAGCELCVLHCPELAMWLERVR